MVGSSFTHRARDRLLCNTPASSLGNRGALDDVDDEDDVAAAAPDDDDGDNDDDDVAVDGFNASV